MQSNKSLLAGLWDFFLSSSVKFKYSFVIYNGIAPNINKAIRRFTHRAGLNVNAMPSWILPHIFNVWYVSLHSCYFPKSNCIFICIFLLNSFIYSFNPRAPCRKFADLLAIAWHNLFLRVITSHQFKSGSPNLFQICTIGNLSSWL